MSGPVPAVTAEQMREVDRLMISEFHIELSQMMENLGRSLAELAIDVFDPGTVVVLAGPGGNGGGGLVAARHLINRGRRVRVVAASPADRMSPAATHQLDVLHRMHAAIVDPAAPVDLAGVDLIIDALLGYSLAGDPREPIAATIRAANAARAPVLSLDAPSGLDVTTGVPGDPCVRAESTLTLALPKTGLVGPDRAEQVGRLYLADISVPPGLYQRMGLDVGPIFAHSAIVPIDGRSAVSGG